jgi:hypothetical protein
MSFSLGMASASITAVAARTKSKHACAHDMNRSVHAKRILLFVLLHMASHIWIPDMMTEFSSTLWHPHHDNKVFPEFYQIRNYNPGYMRKTQLRNLFRPSVNDRHHSLTRPPLQPKKRLLRDPQRAAHSQIRSESTASESMWLEAATALRRKRQ